jgi:hypothetical protein
MPISKTLEKIMEHVSPRRDNHVDQFHPDHIGDYPTHPARDHRSGEPQEDEALRILEHLSEDFVTFVDIPALKGGVLKSLDQIEKILNSIKI